uniref:Uncharacterized protein n=1 Tax=Zea mays TaxID=4577 RepID=A0A804MIZ6_MAIZE
MTRGAGMVEAGAWSTVVGMEGTREEYGRGGGGGVTHDLPSTSMRDLARTHGRTVHHAVVEYIMEVIDNTRSALEILVANDVELVGEEKVTSKLL